MVDYNSAVAAAVEIVQRDAPHPEDMVREEAAADSSPNLDRVDAVHQSISSR